MKYIDADKLIAEIMALKEKYGSYVAKNEVEKCYKGGRLIGYEDALNKTSKLQQEQPDKYKTALEKAREWMPNVVQGGHAILIDIFPELGEGLDPRYGGRKQEQPEVELDFQVFAKEMDAVFNLPKDVTENTEENPLNWEYAIARHFYELGLKARKEE